MLPIAGFPHSDINGSMSACDSPLLFAAGHVLLRRLVPWHPPCALLRLITLLRLVTFLSGFNRKFCNWSFQDSFSSFNVRLSRCAAAKPAFRVLFRILKTIQRTDDSFFLGLCLSTFVLSSRAFARSLFYGSLRNRPRFEASDFSSACSLERR